MSKFKKPLNSPIPTPPVLTLVLPVILLPCPLTGMNNLSVNSPVLPKTFRLSPIGWPPAESIPLPWNQQACIGFRCLNDWNPEALRFS